MRLTCLSDEVGRVRSRPTQNSRVATTAMTCNVFRISRDDLSALSNWCILSQFEGSRDRRIYGTGMVRGNDSQGTEDEHYDS